jgi:uncharacterized membrane protein YphA (DoxX/SURF4 family)
MNSTNLSTLQKTMLVFLRIAIGWHFLYEGVSKMLIPNWTSVGYLQNSSWIFSGFFNWIVSNADVLKVVDLLNIWGLTLVGAALFFGTFTRIASVFGIVLLGFYYVAKPPFVGTDFGVPVEGHYLFVNKILLEMIALFVLVVFPTGLMLGLDRLRMLAKKDKKISKRKGPEKSETLTEKGLNRRELIRNLATVPVLGAFIYGTIKKYNWNKVNAITGASIKVSDTKLKYLAGELPRGNLGNKSVTRLIMGGNLIGGWSHSRDLIYVSSLFKAYNSEKKVFETLALAEKAGINTMNITHGQFDVINKYKRIFNSNLQTISQIHPKKETPFEHVDKVIDLGVDIIQIQGNCCDWRVRDNEIDVLEKAIEYGKSQGYTVGLGAHSIQAIMACDKYGIKPDFYMKTLHHDQYWSAHPKERRIPFSVDGKRSKDHDEFHDNMFCLFPDETIAYMENKNIPLIGFKVLAGGAIHPKDGFKFAFEAGADFICVGMFDWQIVDDVNIAINTLADLSGRKRPWCA